PTRARRAAGAPRLRSGPRQRRVVPQLHRVLEVRPRRPVGIRGLRPRGCRVCRGERRCRLERAGRPIRRVVPRLHLVLEAGPRRPVAVRGLYARAGRVRRVGRVLNATAAPRRAGYGGRLAVNVPVSGPSWSRGTCTGGPGRGRVCLPLGADIHLRYTARGRGPESVPKEDTMNALLAEHAARVID